MEVAAAIEKDEANGPKKHGLDDDQAMAAFAENLNTELSEEDIMNDKEAQRKKVQQAQASKELGDLQSNDATSAFAGLVEQIDVEHKAETYKAGAEGAEDDGGDSIISQHIAEKAEANKVVAKKAAKPKQAWKAQKSMMQDVIDQLHSGKSVDEVREAQLKKLAKAAPPKKKEPKNVPADKEEVATETDNAEVDQQAEEIIN